MFSWVHPVGWHRCCARPSRPVGGTPDEEVQEKALGLSKRTLNGKAEHGYREPSPGQHRIDQLAGYASECIRIDQSWRPDAFILW